MSEHHIFAIVMAVAVIAWAILGNHGRRRPMAWAVAAQALVADGVAFFGTMP